jgi:hypothetical protein
MGTPETPETPETELRDTPSTEYPATYRFDPVTGKPLHAPESALPDNNQPADPNAEQTDEDDFTHYVHLADGQVIKSKGGFTRYFESDDPEAPSIPVIGVYPR